MGKIRRWFARRGVERFLSRISRAGAKDDPAYEHYHWKVVSQKRTLLEQGRCRVAETVGDAVADRLLRSVARRVAAPRRILVLSSVLLWFVPGPLGDSRGALIVFVTPATIIVGNALFRRNALRAGAVLSGDTGDPLSAFALGDVRRAVRRLRRHVPARALGGKRRTEIARHLGESDPDTLEIAGKLSDEFDGSALELLETARRLR